MDNTMQQSKRGTKIRSGSRSILLRTNGELIAVRPIYGQRFTSRELEFYVAGEPIGVRLQNDESVILVMNSDTHDRCELNAAIPEFNGIPVYGDVLCCQATDLPAELEVI